MNRLGLRLELAGAGLLLLRQAGVPVLFGRVDHDLWGVDYVRTGRWRSVLPPMRAAQAAAIGDSGSARWLSVYAEDRRITPVTGLRVIGDPGWIDWFTGNGDLLPMRALSPPDDGRVKAYRKQARDGILPPLLLWWVSGLNCFLLLDGHDRLVAARAEGREPVMLAMPLADPERVRREAAAVVDRYLANDEALRARPVPERVHVELGRQLAKDIDAVERGFRRTVAWPLAGGTAAWTRAAEECAPGWLASLG